MAYCSTWPYILNTFFLEHHFFPQNQPLTDDLAFPHALIWVCSYYTTRCWVYMLAWLAFENAQQILPFKIFRFENKLFKTSYLFMIFHQPIISTTFPSFGFQGKNELIMILIVKTSFHCLEKRFVGLLSQHSQSFCPLSLERMY